MGAGGRGCAGRGAGGWRRGGGGRARARPARGRRRCVSGRPGRPLGRPAGRPGPMAAVGGPGPDRAEGSGPEARAAPGTAPARGTRPRRRRTRRLAREAPYEAQSTVSTAAARDGVDPDGPPWRRTREAVGRGAQCAAQLLGRLGEVLGGVDGAPVGALRERETRQPAFAGEAGEGRALVVAAVGQQVREGGGEDVDAGVDQIRRGRRLDEVQHVPERVGLHGAPGDAGAGQREGGVGVALVVEVGHLAEREAGPDVAVGGVPGLVRAGQRGGRVLQAAAAAQRLGLDNGRDAQRQLGLCQPVLQHLGEMAAGDDRVRDALLGQPVQLMADDRGPGAGNLDHRLGAVVGVRAET